MWRRRGSTRSSCRCRCRPARNCWRGGTSCWPAWMTGCQPDPPPGRGWWRCTGWRVRGRPAWRWSTRTGIWPRPGLRGSSRPRTRRCWLAEFARLAAQLGAREVVDARDPVASVHGVLAAFAAGWLVVFDNAPGQKAVERFVPPAGRGRVLVTSRSALWRPGQAVEVPVLDAQVAAGFLVSLTDNADEGRRWSSLGSWAGCRWRWSRPAAYIQASGEALARYLASFGDRRAELLSRGEARGHWRDGGRHLVAGAVPDWSSETRPRWGCCGCWRSGPRAGAADTCCCADARACSRAGPAAAATAGPLLGDTVRREMRSPRCAATRW